MKPAVRKDIIFSSKKGIEPSMVSELYDNAGLRRPTRDFNRMGEMLNNSDIIISAWDGQQLVGLLRAITDYRYCCYLSDLAVRKECQRQGIGKRLVDELHQILGEEVMILLLAAPEASEYYPKIGFAKLTNAFAILRKK